VTRDELIATLVETLSETFRTTMTAPVARGYLMVLGGLSASELRFAGEVALRECEFMPAPATLLRFALKYRRSSGGTEVDRTTRRLEAMKPKDQPTAEQLEEMRDDWKKTVKKLSEDKS
jgi:hypothetical protein